MRLPSACRSIVCSAIEATFAVRLVGSPVEVRAPKRRKPLFGLRGVSSRLHTGAQPRQPEIGGLDRVHAANPRSLVFPCFKRTAGNLKVRLPGSVKPEREHGVQLGIFRVLAFPKDALSGRKDFLSGNVRASAIPVIAAGVSSAAFAPACSAESFRAEPCQPHTSDRPHRGED